MCMNVRDTRMHMPPTTTLCIVWNLPESEDNSRCVQKESEFWFCEKTKFLPNRSSPISNSRTSSSSSSLHRRDILDFSIGYWITWRLTITKSTTIPFPPSSQKVYRKDCRYQKPGHFLSSFFLEQNNILLFLSHCTVSTQKRIQFFKCTIFVPIGSYTHTHEHTPHSDTLIVM